MSSNKRQVFEQLLAELRGSQSATARFDQAVADAAGLNRTDMRILDALDREEAVPAGRLAEVTGLSSGAMTTELDRLERAGYARRARDAGDRRRVLVELTERAATLQRFYAEHAAYAERLCRPDILTDFGLRTLSSEHPQFSARAYHRGAIWPFYSWLGWGGLRAAGRPAEAERVRAGVLAALEGLGDAPEL